MEKSNVLTLIAIFVCLAALVADHTVGVKRFAPPHHVDIDAFPTHVGNWRMTAQAGMPADLNGIFKDASGYERTYTYSDGEAVKLLLLNATRYGDFHSPAACFPAQGWTIGSVRQAAIENYPVSIMDAHASRADLTVLWWFMAPETPANASPRAGALEKFEQKLLDRPEGTSLLVRVIAPADTRRPSMNELFAASAMPILRNLVRVHDPKTTTAIQTKGTTI